MATMKIKKGDMVRVISGSERDNEGKVIAVDREKHRVYVEGVHMVKKHMKPSMATDLLCDFRPVPNSLSLSFPP